MEVTEIKNVPHSIGTSWDVIEVFNPLSEPFTWSMDGKLYTIPANNSKGFPEFIARHLAKHLARKIVYANAYAEIKEASRGQLTPDNAKAIPNTRVERMEDWILKPTSSSPEKNIEVNSIKEEQVEIKSQDLEDTTEMKLKEKLKRMKRQKKALREKLKKPKEEEQEKETN